MFIKIEIEDCSGCPFMESKRVYTADSFEMPFEWKCTKANKVIAGFVEHNDKIPVPKWCPCRIEDIKSNINDCEHKNIEKVGPFKDIWCKDCETVVKSGM